MMKKPTRSEVVFGLGTLATLLICFVWAKYGVAVYNIALDGADPHKASEWADTFEPLNAIASSLALVGVAMTLVLQSRTIQRQSLDTQRQVDDQHRQQFDRAFFELLDLLREIRTEVFFKYSPEYISATSRTAVDVAHGAEALSRAGREVSYWIRQKNKMGELQETWLARIYATKVHRRSESRLGPYYRVIYTILGTYIHS